jgi:cytochrome c peroxidase
MSSNVGFGRYGYVTVIFIAGACAASACGDDGGEPTSTSSSSTSASSTTGAGAGGAGGGGGAPDTWTWELPPGFPVPIVPEDNPMSADKVELGRHLFYDVRLSENETQSCGTCHRQELAFTDGLASAVGSTGEAHPRSSMTIANVAYSATVTWANPLLLQLETQAAVPIFGTQPVELGMNGKEALLESRLEAEPVYVELFPAAFPDDPDPVSVKNVVRALAAFQRTVISGSSRYDRYAYGGDADALSESEKRGLELFNAHELECFHCHQGFNFQDSITHEGKPFAELRFHNTGLYNVGGTGAYPAPNTGIHDVTGLASDMGKFRVPTLRNIAVTGPYMHDGSIETLSEVLDHYAAGGRTIESGPYAGVGSESPLKSNLVPGFVLTEEMRADLLAFFESLTDEAFLTDPRFSDPWQR